MIQIFSLKNANSVRGMFVPSEEEGIYQRQRLPHSGQSMLCRGNGRLCRRLSGPTTPANTTEAKLCREYESVGRFQLTAESADRVAEIFTSIRYNTVGPGSTWDFFNNIKL